MKQSDISIVTFNQSEQHRIFSSACSRFCSVSGSVSSESVSICSSLGSVSSGIRVDRFLQSRGIRVDRFLQSSVSSSSSSRFCSISSSVGSKSICSSSVLCGIRSLRSSNSGIDVRLQRIIGIVTFSRLSSIRCSVGSDSGRQIIHKRIDIAVKRIKRALQCSNFFFLAVQCIHRNRNSFYVNASERSVSGSSIHFDTEVQAGS